MHGVGLASSTNRKGSRHAETIRQGSCKQATHLALGQIRAWQPSHPTAWAHLRSTFGDGAVARLQTTGAADALFARECHGLPPPCAAGGGCVDSATQRAVWQDANSFYCARFGGTQGGQRASQLAMLPLLRELLTRLQRAARHEEGARLHLFSGHDTVIAPLLAALGAFGPGTCRWRTRSRECSEPKPMT